MLCPVCGNELSPNKGWAAQFYDGYCNVCDEPIEDGLRFSEEDLDRAMERLDLEGERGRREAARILREWDSGNGDVDDVIDRYEDEEAY